MVLAVYAALPAFAVHDNTFQLDGDVSASTTTNVGGNAQTVDWSTLFDSAGAPKTLPTGFTASAFDRDFGTNPGCSLTAQTGTFCTSDATTYATGSKDTLPITPGWQCNKDANVNSKIDIMNSYSAAYTAPNGDQILYFGLERNTNTGDGNVGFWFLQDDVGCVSPGGSTAFSGDHSDGDLLIVSAFTNGGSVSTIDVYRWNGGANGSLGTTPVAHGVDCKTTASNDTACATVNGPTNGTGGTITTPWLTSTKTTPVGHSLQTSDFFEGGLNLTKSNLGGHCFNVFIGDTRSSQSLTATLFDFARGKLGECTSTTVTTPKDDNGDNIPASGLSIGANASVDVHDSALLTVTGVPSYGGDVTFSLCGPLALNSTSNCATGGVQIGQPVDVAGTSPETVVGPTASLTKVGRYCWRAVYSGDDSVGVPGSSDPKSPTDTSVSECFKINPLTPHLTTQAGSSPVDFGQPVTDTATLTGTANEPGTGGLSDGSINPTTAGGPAQGTITFTLFKNDCTTKATGTGTNPQTVNVSGDSTYGPVSFTPDAPGTYHWVATYSGDSPNTNPTPASDSVCGADPNEDVVVRTIPTEIKTQQGWYPNDTATIKSTIGNLAAGGTVDFSLFAGSTCSGSAFYSQSFNVAGGNPTETFTTTNTTVSIATAFADPANSTTGVYSWKVVYTPAAGDTAHTGKQSACGAEHFDITYTNDPGPGTDLP